MKYLSKSRKFAFFLIILLYVYSASCVKKNNSRKNFQKSSRHNPSNGIDHLISNINYQRLVKKTNLLRKGLWPKKYQFNKEKTGGPIKQTNQYTITRPKYGKSLENNHISQIPKISQNQQSFGKLQPFTVPSPVKINKSKKPTKLMIENLIKKIKKSLNQIKANAKLKPSDIYNIINKTLKIPDYKKGKLSSKSTSIVKASSSSSNGNYSSTQKKSLVSNAVKTDKEDHAKLVAKNKVQKEKLIKALNSLKNSGSGTVQTGTSGQKKGKATVLEAYKSLLDDHSHEALSHAKAVDKIVLFTALGHLKEGENIIIEKLRNNKFKFII